VVCRKSEVPRRKSLRLTRTLTYDPNHIHFVSVADKQYQTGSDPSTDPTQFLSSLSADFTGTRVQLTSQMGRWMGTGTITEDVHSPALDTLSFFGGGSVLDSFARNQDEMMQEAKEGILKQLGTSVLAGIWMAENVTFFTTDKSVC
jgi:hypothetical protein